MSVGTAPYQHGGMRSAPHLAFEKLKRKCALRAALAAVTAEVSAAVVALNEGELLELQELMQADVDATDGDVAVLVAEESALAKTTRAMSVVISRKASVILGKEAERRVRRGIYPSSEALIGEAVEKAFGS